MLNGLETAQWSCTYDYKL